MIKNLTSLSKWTAVLALLIAPLAAPVMAQETGTVKISGRFSMDYLSGELDLYYFEPDLLGVYNNGHEHTWTLTLHGTSQSHNSNGSYYGTEIHSTSFDLEFFGPDAATLNRIVSKHLAGRSVSVYLQNTYYSSGGGFAIMHVGVGGGVTGELYFYTGQDMGSLTLFPADANGYPVVRPEPFSIEPDITELSEFEMFSGTGFNMGSLAGLVTFSSPLPGDFNGDNVVDAADYVVWRKGLGTPYTQDDCNPWRAHFGSALGAGSGSVLPSTEPLSAAVPEPPSTSLLLVFGLAVGIQRRCRVAAQVPSIRKDAYSA